MIWEKEYSVNSTNIDINKRLSLPGILGMLQDVASLHADRLGFGVESLLAQKMLWVLAQQKLVMHKWPKWQEQIIIKTWPRVVQGFKAYRDFEIYLAGEKIGECVGLFMMLDGGTRRPVRPEMGDFHPIEEELSFVPSRIEILHDLELIDTIKVRISDLDMNQHVNNTRYAQWILDSIPVRYHRTVNLQEFEVNFIAEAYLNEEIDIFIQNLKAGQQGVGACFLGVRRRDQKKVFVVSCRGNWL